MSEPIIDIIICTYQRESLLMDAVSSLTGQSDFSNCQVIVVNNAPELLCQNTLDFLQEKNCKIINQPSPGLSIARNTGIKNSRSDWLLFFDDDARAPKGFITKVKEIISSEPFDCFGGGITSWWKFGKPRWLAQDYGSKPILLEKRGVLSEGYNWGSNIIIKRHPLMEVANFPVSTGMKGTQLGYSAENIVQQNLRKAGYTVGYDPELTIEHIVMPQKLKLSWHLRWAYATGRDGRHIFPEQYDALGMLHSLKNCISRPLKSIWFLATKEDYYWQNTLLESLSPYYLLVGKLHSLLF